MSNRPLFKDVQKTVSKMFWMLNSLKLTQINPYASYEEAVKIKSYCSRYWGCKK